MSVGRLVVGGQTPTRLASIGKPLPNVTCYVVDPATTTTATTLMPLLQPLGGELGPLEVAARHLHAAQPQLAPHADRLQQGR